MTGRPPLKLSFRTGIIETVSLVSLRFLSVEHVPKVWRPSRIRSISQANARWRWNTDSRLARPPFDFQHRPPPAVFRCGSVELRASAMKEICDVAVL